MDVIVFTLNDCEHCKDLKTKLSNAQISFKEFEINEHKPFWDDIVKQTGADVVPTLYLMDKINKRARILIGGKDFNSGDEAIKIIKKNTL
jgi:glutaredoxin